jgi:hypothetical protein
VGAIHRRLRDRYPEVYMLIKYDKIYDLSKIDRNEVKQEIIRCIQKGC